VADQRPKSKTRSDTKGTSGRPEAIRIRLLGGFQVAVGARTIEEDAWRLRKAASLVKLLALAPNHRLHREQVMEALWPDLGKSGASNNLRGAIHDARKTLTSDPTAGSHYLATRGESLVLSPQGVLWVDVDAFEEAARAAHHSREPAAYGAALDLYAGGLLPSDRYEEWAEEHRRRLRETYLSLLLGLARLHKERVDYDSAIEALRRVVAEESTREEAHAGLMRLYALSGSKGEALAQYEWLEEVLLKELGTEPAASSRALKEEIAAGRLPPKESRPFGSLPEETLGAGRHNLPAARTSFVGREREMVEVKRELAMTRLLTLTGAGGSGKTRLALEVARDLVWASLDGVWLAELAPLSDSGLVPQAVAGALGVKEQPGRPLTDTLAEGLHAKEMLLLLDNCEHLIDAAAHVVDVLLDSCPGLRVLATSREALGVAGEVRWNVPALSVPDLRYSPTVAEIDGTEAVRLFAERARQRDPTFTLGPENARTVAEICERLEGMPLAIELAAARVGTLAVEQISERLEDALKLLTSGSRTEIPRQRTLRGALDWSHELLSEGDKKFFGRLSVFAGGWTLEAAEAVGSGEGVEEDDILDLLSGVVEKSLVVAEATEASGVRYRMLEPVRQYAQEKLEEGGEGEEVRLRHARFFLALAEDAEPRLRGSVDVEWFERLEAEHDNIRAALSWALERGVVGLGLRLAGALRMFWEAHGHAGEGRRWLEEALAKDDRASVAARVRALEAVGWLTVWQMDLDQAEAVAQEGIELSAEAGIESSLAASFRTMLGVAATLRGDFERAKELLEESLKLSREANDKVGIVDALLFLGNASVDQGDHDRAKELWEEGIAMCREVGYTVRLPNFLTSLGYTLLLEGDYERAAALNEEAAALFRERGFKGGFQWVLDNLGWAALLQGDHERAETFFVDSLTLCEELGDKLVASKSLEGLACVAGAKGEAERAARLFGAAEVLLEAVGRQHPPEEAGLREPYLVAARSQLDEASWEAAWAQGRAMSMEQAIEYALSEEKPTPPSSPAPKRPPADEPPSLTPREREVAVLVARGLTNRQIASELTLSEHTVLTHVRNILKRLNLRSRAQLAAWVTERQPLP
jgi:predicted ATPase/DNA-binding SARP family transcriptional activator/DNA-binding CsgD family transcriptional regulator